MAQSRSARALSAADCGGIPASRSGPVPAWFVVLDNIRQEDSEVYDAVVSAIEHGPFLR